MPLFLFWLKIAVKRTVAFLKQFPVLAAGTVVIVLSFAVAGVNAIARLDAAKCLTILSFFTVISLAVSLKPHNITPVLLLYAKSGRPRKRVRAVFFVKKAFANNVPLLLFDIVVITGLVRAEGRFYFPLFTLCSLLCSLLVMLVKDNRAEKGAGPAGPRKTRPGAAFRAALYDYLTPEFFQDAAVTVSLFIVAFIEIIKARIALRPRDDQANIFLALAAALSLGFPAIINSIPHINWKYYAVVSPQGFSYHFKNTAVFLLCSFGLFIAAFIVLGLFVDARLTLVSLYGVSLVFIFSVSAAFTSFGMIVKALLLIAAVVFFLWFSLWTGFTRPFLMLLLLLPVLAGLAKARIDYREWYIL
jgi:hypothetical protein